MLTHEAFNALLKTLEEPPKRVIFIFATTEPHKVPPTVISRCQVFEFKNIQADKIEEYLEKVGQGEGIEASSAALRAIARRAKGSLRDALVMLEQLAAYVGKRKIEEDDFLEVLGLPSEELISTFLKAILAKDGKKALSIIDELTQGGKDPELFLESLIEFCRDLIVAKVQGKSDFKELAFSLPELINLNNQLLALKREMRFSLDKRIMLEVGILAITNANANFAAKNEPQDRREASAEIKNKKEEELEVQEATTSAQIQDLGEAWTQMLEAIKKEKRNAVYAFLAEGKPIVAEDLLRIEFDPKFKFHKEGLEKAENRRFLEKMIKEFYGNKKLEIALSSESSSPQTKRSKKPKDELREKAELVKETFDGEIIT